MLSLSLSLALLAASSNRVRASGTSSIFPVAHVFLPTYLQKMEPPTRYDPPDVSIDIKSTQVETSAQTEAYCLPGRCFHERCG